MKFLMLGCGFLSTHLIPHLIPYASRFILVDKERIEDVNYDNYILPKLQAGKRKVSAIATLIQVLSNVSTILIHTEIKRVEDLVKIHTEYNPDMAIVTFDNIKSRIIAREYANKMDIPCIFIGVSENMVYIDWAESIALPELNDEKTIKHIENSMQRVRDVCTRLEFRGIGLIATAYAYRSIVEYINNSRKYTYIIRVNDDEVFKVVR